MTETVRINLGCLCATAFERLKYGGVAIDPKIAYGAALEMLADSDEDVNALLTGRFIYEVEHNGLSDGECGGGGLEVEVILERAPTETELAAREDLTSAEQMLYDDGFISTPQVFCGGCYICRDPDFAQMGLPLCYPCEKCKGHVAADDTICDDCDHDHTFNPPEN